MPSPSTDRTRDELRLGLLLRRSHRRAAKALTVALAPLGIDGRHFGVLMSLARRDDGATQNELIGAVEGDKATMTRTLDDLESLGAISRTTSSTDRRARVVRITADGRRLTARATQAAGEVSGALFARIDDAELSALVAALSRFVDGDDAS